MAMGPVRGTEEEAYAPLAEINVTPMVDVMLVLLVIFMVAAPLMTVGVPVQLPKTAAPKVAQPRTPLIVSIDRDGRVFVGETELTPETLGPHLASLARESPDQVVLVRGDKAIDYGRVMTVMGQVGQAGFAKVSLIAQGTPAAGAPAAGAPAPNVLAPAGASAPAR
jgi:biopolymer transport protein TolR